MISLLFVSYCAMYVSESNKRRDGIDFSHCKLRTLFNLLIKLSRKTNDARIDFGGTSNYLRLECNRVKV